MSWRGLRKGGTILDTHRASSAEDTVDQELDRLISRRASSDMRPDPDENEELWKSSVRAHNARVRAENRAAWCEYHQGQAASLRQTLEGLIAHHETQAMKLGNLKGAS